MKTEVGRNDTDDLYFTLAAETQLEERMLRLLVKGIRDQSLMCQILCAADTDETVAVGKSMEGTYPIEIQDRDKPAMYLCGKVFESVQRQLKMQR